MGLFANRNLATWLLLAFLAFTLVLPVAERFDDSLAEAAEAAWDSPWEGVISWIGSSASPVSSLILLAAVLLPVAWRRGVGTAVVVAAAFSTMVLIELVLKYFLGSYPSGHVARAAFLSATAVLLLPPRWWWAGAVFVATLAVIVAIQRVANDHHTPTDVIGGMLLGSGMAVASAGREWTLTRLPGSRWRRSHEMSHVQEDVAPQ